MGYSTAISAQNTAIAIEGSAGSAITVTAVSAASAAVVTGANSLAAGDVVELGVITGMEALAGTLGIVSATGLSAGSFQLNVDTSAYAAPGGAGSATPKTWLRIGNIKDYAGFDGSVTDIDVSNLDSAAMEYRPGLQDFGQFTFNLDTDDSNAGQAALRTARTQAATKAFRLVLPNGRIRAFKGYCKKFTESGAVNGVIKAAIDIRITGVVSFGGGTAAGVASGLLQPRYAAGIATAGVGGSAAALFALMTTFGSSGTRVGSFTPPTPAANNYNWVAVLDSACAPVAGVPANKAVGFTQGAAYPGTFNGGWNGASSAGAYAGAGTDPCQSAVTFVDGNGNTWRMFRQDNAAVASATYAIG